MKQEPFIIERTYNAPIKKVWQAIKDKDQMKEWYFDLAAFKAEVGFEFQFIGGSPEKKYVHLCKVTEVVVNRKLTYSWSYEGYPGMSLVTFELSPDGEKTHLKLTHAGIDSFPDEKDFARTSFAKGWTHIIGTNLENFLENKKVHH